MTKHARRLMAGPLALGLVLLAGASNAADKDEIRAKVDKLAATAAKDQAAAAKDGAAFAKALDDEGFTAVMDLFRKRTKEGKGGWGIGPKATGQPDDGIEARIQNLGRRPLNAAALDKEAEALAQMAYRTAAIAEITVNRAPDKKTGDKDPKDWKEYSKRMVASSYELAGALKSKDPKAVKDAASKLNSSCSDCHGKFRD